MPPLAPTLLIAAALILLPVLAFGFEPRLMTQKAGNLSRGLRLFAPALLAIPYVLVTHAAGDFHWGWLALYLVLPVAISFLLRHAAAIDHDQNGAWPDLVVLAVLGLAVDLRWFESAWPPGLAAFNKMLLLDAGLWGYCAVRHLHKVGFDLRLRLADLRIGAIYFALYTPVALALGFALGFLHLHRTVPEPLRAAGALLFTFFLIAVPEELFFRGWIQNLLERRLGRIPALVTTSVLFGLSHFNKRAVHFNWRYVLLATIAGLFYGSAWRQQRRVAGSAIAHTLVDTVWGLWFR